MKVRVPRCKQCWGQHAELMEGDQLQCVECNERRSLDSAAIGFIKKIERMFGPIVEPIVLRDKQPALRQLAAPAEEPEILQGAAEKTMQ